MSLYIGLMSGTSMDGIDVALVDLPGNKLISALTITYSDDVQSRLYKLLESQDVNLAGICQLNTLIGREFAGAVKELLHQVKISSTDITAIGSHGQTVCHDPNGAIPYTLQLGCAHTISSLTGITVVADFRTRDIVNGGQGAPFAPLYHKELFKRVENNIALVNIGGIANISLLIKDQPSIGWDVGPGNCLMDAWINKHHDKKFDANGEWASQGRVIQSLLDELCEDSFFQMPAPKSIGKEYFSLDWLESKLEPTYQPVDIQATLLKLCAWCISKDIAKHDLKALYLCGGGAHNLELLRVLSQMLPTIKVKSTESLGINPNFIEAMMIAWLAWQTINNQPVDLSSITGSTKSSILGAIYPHCH